MNKNIRPSTVFCFSCVMSGAHALYNGVLIISHHSCVLTREVNHCVIQVDKYIVAVRCWAE